MAGLDQTNMKVFGKPSDDYMNGQSRLDTTQQMRTILENSRLDESILSADLRGAYNGGWGALTTVKDPTQQITQDEAAVVTSRPVSKFDELYHEALRNTESILSQCVDGRITLHSPARSVDCETSRLDKSHGSAMSGLNGNSARRLAQQDYQLETSTVPESGIYPVPPLNKSHGSTISGQNGNKAGKLTQQDYQLETSTVRHPVPPSNKSHGSTMSGENGNSAGSLPEEWNQSGVSRSQDKSVDSGRVDETEISEEYTTTEDDDIEEIHLNSH